MSLGRTFNVIVVPDNHSGTRQYKVSLGLLYLAAILGVAIFATTVIFMATYGRTLHRARAADHLAEENAELREQIMQVNQLNEQLEELSALRAQIVKLLGGELDEATEGLDAWGEAELPLASLEPERFDHLSAAEVFRSFSPSAWPTEGTVSREFFLAGPDGPHPGLDIATLPGAVVVAAGRGRVAAIGYSEDQGKQLVVDHGLGIQSTYAGLDRILVEAGQMVDRSQPLAYLGNSTDEDQSQLFFGVRVDGESIDPRRYLTKHPRE